MPVPLVVSTGPAETALHVGNALYQIDGDDPVAISQALMTRAGASQNLIHGPFADRFAGPIVNGDRQAPERLMGPSPPSCDRTEPYGKHSHRRRSRGRSTL